MQLNRIENSTMEPEEKETEMRERVIGQLNAIFGKDVNNLGKSVDLLKSLTEQKQGIENRLSLASTEVPSKVNAALQEVAEVQEKISAVTISYDALSCDVRSHLNKVESPADHLYNCISQVTELEKWVAYTEILKTIDEISTDIECALLMPDEFDAVAGFVKLVRIFKRIQGSSCENLVEYVNSTVLFWHQVLKERLSQQYEKVLETIKWPFVSTNVSVSSSPPTAEVMQRFQLLTQYLLEIELPVELTTKPIVTSALLVDFKPLVLPLQLLVRPFRKRFVYHFCGNKQTNNLAKPEWFFTQVLSWIRDHASFLEQRVQPVFERVGLAHLPAKVELMRGLVQVVIEKLHSDLPEMQDDDALFSHAVDETLSFERELRTLWGYPPSYPSVLSVLTQAQCFVRWINMEKKYAVEKMDHLLSSPTAWQCLSCSDVDELKVTECGEGMITLLLTMTDRYKALPQPGHRLQFVELQLELLDDFRVRLMQLLRNERQDPLDSSLPAILNTIDHLISVLQEWSDLPHYLQMQFYKMQYENLQKEQQHSESFTLKNQQNVVVKEEDGEGEKQSHCENEEEEINKFPPPVKNLWEVNLLSMDFELYDGDSTDYLNGTVFDEILDLFDHVRSELLKTVCDAVMMDVKAKSRQYRKDRWYVMPSLKECVKASITPSACPMFQTLAARLHQAQDILSVPLFSIVWQQLCLQLDQFIYEELILENQFSEGGAAQFQFDMTRNLFPLFGQYTQKPENYFKMVKEACILLNLADGPALLLQDTLRHTLNSAQDNLEEESSATDVLSELGIFRLSVEDALTILGHRIGRAA